MPTLVIDNDKLEPLPPTFSDMSFAQLKKATRELYNKQSRLRREGAGKGDLAEVADDIRVAEDLMVKKFSCELTRERTGALTAERRLADEYMRNAYKETPREKGGTLVMEGEIRGRK